jgi:hypothetical protein
MHIGRGSAPLRRCPVKRSEFYAAVTRLEKAIAGEYRSMTIAVRQQDYEKAESCTYQLYQLIPEYCELAGLEVE